MIDRSAFLAGRDLACEMLRHPATEGDSCSIEAKYREPGAEQVNYVLQFLNRLASHPELAEGFAAVISDYLSCTADVEVYERLSIGEMLGDGAPRLL